MLFPSRGCADPLDRLQSSRNSVRRSQLSCSISLGAYWIGAARSRTSRRSNHRASKRKYFASSSDRRYFRLYYWRCYTPRCGCGVVCFHRSRPSSRRARNVIFTLGLGAAYFYVAQGPTRCVAETCIPNSCPPLVVPHQPFPPDCEQRRHNDGANEKADQPEDLQPAENSNKSH